MAANKAGLLLTLEDGTDLSDRVNPRFISLTLTEKRGEESDALDLTLHNHDGLLIPPKKGIYLTLALGWISGNDVPLGLVNKGRFKVDEVEREGPPDIITIRARAADVNGPHRKRRDRAWKDTTLGAIIRAIAGEDGGMAAVHPDLDNTAIAIIEQGTKSNKAFVRDLGRRYDAVATWKNRTLIFMPIGSDTTASGAALPDYIWTKRDGWRWNFRAANHDDNDGAEAVYHDQDAGETKMVKTGGENRKRLKKTYANESDAMAASKSAAAKSKRSIFEFGYALAYGDPSIGPNAKVTLVGWDSEIDAIKWIVNEAVHNYDGGGLSTNVRLETAGK
jgi:phage protein D